MNLDPAFPFFDAAVPLLYDVLSQETRPLFLYGTGDGADKILDVLAHKGIRPAGIFVSEDFYRGQTFRGYPVTTLSRLEALYPPDGFVCLVAFGSHLPDMIRLIRNLCRRHPTYIPDVPVTGGTLFDDAFCRCHREELLAADALWADEASRQVYRSVIDYKLTGRPEPLFASVSSKEEVFSSLLSLSDREVYLDAGAYTGDTLEEFLTAVSGHYQAIHALEPDPKTFARLSRTWESHEGVRLYRAATGRRCETGTMLVSRGRGNHILSDAEKEALPAGTPGRLLDLPIVTVDSLTPSPTYVKLDVEGAEQATLEGALHTLTATRPKLNIALYHRSEDLFAIPLWLKKVLPSYRFYLRRHACFPCWDLNLYAMPDD